MVTLAQSCVPKECRSVFKQVFISFLTSIFAGTLLPFAFAPFHYWPFAILSPLLLMWVWQQATPKQAFWQGVCFGLGFFGLGVSWVFVSIHYYGNTDIPLAVFLTFLFVFILSLFLATQGYVLNRFFKGKGYAYCLLGFPCAWVIFEWLRSVLFGGFPWAFLGYAALETPLRGIAPILSVWGVSWLMAVSAGALLLLLQTLKKPSHKTFYLLALLGTIWLGSDGLTHLQYTKPLANARKAYRVAMVQGNIPPLDKFSAENPLEVVENVYGRLTQDHWKNDLILWPENAITYPLPFAKTYLETLKAKAEAHQSSLISGIQTQQNTGDYYNSMVMLGVNVGLYHKRHLVPFGEFLPFDRYLRGLINFFDIPMSNFIEGPSQQPFFKMDHGKINLAPLICYEIAYPELLRQSLISESKSSSPAKNASENATDRKNAHVIVTLSEDGWFGKSLGPHQHLEIAQMRALETGRYVLRSTTSGISAIIKPDGSIAEKSSQFEASVLTGEFEAREGNTPWMLLGIWPLLLFCLMGFWLPGRIRIGSLTA